MVNFKNILICTMLFLGVLGFSLSAVSAHDPFPPEIKYLSPKDNSDVSGIVKIKTNIYTHTGIDEKGLSFNISGPNNYTKILKDINPNDGWGCVWDTSSAPNGRFSIKAEAWDVDYPDGPGTNTIYVNLYNVKKATKVGISNVKAPSNNNINIMATLKDGSNKIITNKKIQFTINGKTYTRVTDNGGIAKVSFKGSKGIFNINAKFLGDNTYSTSSKNAKLTITKSAPTLKLSSIVADKNKKTQLKASLTYNTKKLAKKLIRFYVNNVAVGSSKTNKNGVAVLNYKAKLNSGKYTVSAKYSTDIINSANLKVKKTCVYPQITSSKVKPKAGTTITIFYRIKNDGPDSATNTKLVYKIPSTFKYAKAVGAGIKKYNPKTKTFSWTLKTAKVGTSLLKLTFKTIKSGRSLLTPKITTDTVNTYSSAKKTYITIV